jgi:hypothetical protein
MPWPGARSAVEEKKVIIQKEGKREGNVSLPFTFNLVLRTQRLNDSIDPMTISSSYQLSAYLTRRPYDSMAIFLSYEV